MISIHWFRRDLRVEDNRALNAALQSEYPVRCIFIFDRQILDKLEDRSDARVTFIHGELQRLDTTLRKYGSSLQVFFGNPLEVWQDILSTTDVKEVFCNRDYEPYAIQRDKQVYDLMLSRGVKFTGRKDHVIFEKDEVVKDDGKPYTVFTPYSKKWKLLLKSRLTEIESTTTKVNFETNSSGTIPTLESMGFTRNSTIAIPSKEIASDVIIRYHEQRDIPSVNGTSRLSLHLRFGTIGIRELVRIGLEKNEKWLNELIWRDFYQMILYHFPHSATSAFKPAYDHIQWLNDESDFQKWCRGETGYPIVDAGMRELNTTGFMHNRVRMITASFLTKHLLIDWRWGERYFAAKLLDFELASNVGGWQWAAGSGCDAAPYFRVFNPALQTEKFDPSFQYIKTWVTEYGTSAYPTPIVEHSFARERAISTYRKALKP